MKLPANLLRYGERVDALTLRERLSEHRSNPACASCHQRIDPIGFGLENYDVLGRWRTKEEAGGASRRSYGEFLLEFAAADPP